MPQKQVPVINQEILVNNMPPTLLSPLSFPIPPPFLRTYVRTRIFIMYLDFAKFLRLLSRVSFEIRESIYLSCAKCLIITTQMFFLRVKLHIQKKYQALQT